MVVDSFRFPLNLGWRFPQWRKEANLFTVIWAECFAFNVSKVEHQALWKRSESDNQDVFPGTVRDSDEIDPRSFLFSFLAV